MRLVSILLIPLVCAANVAVAQVTSVNDVILVPADESIAPFNRQFDLTGKTLTFTPLQSGSYTVGTSPLTFDEEEGQQLATDRVTRAAAYEIAGFDFPFFGTPVRKLSISQLVAIYPGHAPAAPDLGFFQYGDAELLAGTTPVIAPLLSTLRGHSGQLPKIRVKETDDRVVVTWREQNRGLAIQAVLRSDGVISFSYRDSGTTRGGAVLITSGNETWRIPAELGAASDPANDVVSSGPPAIAAMVDITGARISRIADTNLLHVAVSTRAAVDRAVLGPAGSIGITVRFGGSSAVVASISGSGPSEDRLGLPRWGVSGALTPIRIDGDTVTLMFDQEFLALSPEAVRAVTVTMAHQTGGDSVNVPARIEAPSRSARTEFAALSSPATLDGPIEQTFTLPNVNVAAIRERVEATYRLDPTQIDGIAIYENFLPSSLFTVHASASVGNPGADNIRARDNSSSTSRPRTPNIMHMGPIRPQNEPNDDAAAFLLLHEFGHRWLFGVEIDDGSSPPDVLIDGGGHPVIYADTRAAFPVLSSEDCSVMGGNRFADNGNGTFTTPFDVCSAGYSWLELYLMGLAAPDEVPPFFYLTDADPPFHPGLMMLDFTYKATRKDLTISNVTARIGVRNPLYPNTQRAFRVLFVLAYDPSRPLLDDDVRAVEHNAHLFRDRFARATGGRGSIVTAVTLPRRRAVGVE